MAKIAFVFNQLPLHASARQGLDMLMMAVSLDQACVACYEGNAVWQLVPVADGQPDPLKKIQMLPDLFDFTDFYVCAESLAQAELNAADLRVPVQIVPRSELNQILSASQHLIRFNQSDLCLK
ncbi:DsrE family protein [Aliidiomarina haloalkalitolerans]|uniref:Uncharacterized protein n=1 Tax=Aliidiomarina haloalkalitolerans TaxID=859059 RepID=A0A432VY57_9GAMM|nr:DsrE family protein [Aliidiomarina haloalkalitolerans]MCL4409806.1 DsrE family protein [Gammaproteobacteria bacterium]RUO21622.1 hypothetical protein CWE06_01845 [Aliidiomarina haloalkalitolerans]